jgi:hypothetical protein
MKKPLWSGAVVGLLLVGACSSSDDSGGSVESNDDDASASAPADDTTTTGGSSSGCPDTTSLEIVFGDEPGTEFDVVTAWSDGGPHPDSTVDSDDSNMSFVFADYEIPVDEQFGYSIPIAGSEVPVDGTELQISLFLDGTIEAGTTYVDQTADDETLAEYDGEINFISLHEPGERAVLGETVVTITEIDDDVVCGEISGVSSTDLQELTAVNGEFVADRVQALEAEADADE